MQSHTLLLIYLFSILGALGFTIANLQSRRHINAIHSVVALSCAAAPFLNSILTVAGGLRIVF